MHRKKPHPILVILGSNVLYFRRKLGITQEELGFRAELHQSYISDVERALRQPNLPTVYRVATALEVQTFELLIERRDAMAMWSETFV